MRFLDDVCLASRDRSTAIAWNTAWRPYCMEKCVFLGIEVRCSAVAACVASCGYDLLVFGTPHVSSIQANTLD